MKKIIQINLNFSSDKSPSEELHRKPRIPNTEELDMEVVEGFSKPVKLELNYERWEEVNLLKKRGRRISRRT